MNLSDERFNELLLKYKQVVISIADRYRYPSNITHLLYLIVPAFVIKYGIQNERWIISCFQKTEIKITRVEDEIYQAYYYARPYIEGEQLMVETGIRLNRYEQIPLMQLLDNLVHEMNHAVNSYQMGFVVDQQEVKLRSGLMSFVYDKNTLAYLRKNDATVLEEVINTKQTEEIVDLIHSFYKISLEDEKIKNTLYSIHHSIDQNFESSAYLLQTRMTRSLLENKTFFSTVENFRLTGNIDDVEGWFDQIVFQKGSYQKLLQILSKSLSIQMELSHKKYFRSWKESKLKGLISECRQLIETFNHNCNYR